MLLFCSFAATAQTTLLDLEGDAPVFEDFNGSATMFIANPDVQAPNESATVAENTIPANQEFAGIKITQAVNLADGKTFRLQVWSPIADAPVLLKFESEVGGPTTERAATASGPANSWQELTFDFSSDANASYLFVVIFMNFNVNTNTAPITFYWDNLVQSDDGGGGGMGDGTQMDLPVTFDDPDVDYGLEDFGGNASMFALNPEDNTDTVASSIKTAGSATFAGTTLNSTSGGPQGFASAIPFSAEETTITMNVWSPTAGTPVRMKVEKDNDPTISVETQVNTSVANGWETLTFDFASEVDGTTPLNLASTYNKLSVFFDFGSEPMTETTYLWDDLIFNGEGGTGGGFSAPMSAAPTPTQDAADVISIFSGVYDDVPVDTYLTEWSDSGLTDTVAGGDAVLRYDNLGFAGIETVMNPVDLVAAGITHFHFDIWSPNVTEFRFKLVDFGGTGFDPQDDNTEAEVAQQPASGQWVSYDLPLAAFAGMNFNDINQFVISADPFQSATVYLDNIYFYAGEGGGGGDDTPMVAAPDPTRDAANVISMFSNVYTDVPVDTWRTEWSQADLTDIQIQGNDTKQYDNLAFVGVETIATPIDLEAAEMTHLHVNYWTADLDSMRIKLVDFLEDGFDGPNGITEDELTFATEKMTWGTLEIPLDDFAAMSAQSDINQLLFVGVPGGGTVFIDNVYYYKRDPDATTTPLTGVLEVYPNPTQNRINIAAPVRMDNLELYGTNGQLVGKWQVNAERFDLDLSHLAPGLYVALVNTADGPLTVKVLKN